jgi:hypothetical protein
MDQAMIDSVLMTYPTLMRGRLGEAASIGRAAEACSKAGNVAKAIEIAMTSSSSPMRSTPC